MKQTIILLCMISLGLIIYNLVIGTQEGSVMNTVKYVWQEEIDMKKRNP